MLLRKRKPNKSLSAYLQFVLYSHYSRLRRALLWPYWRQRLLFERDNRKYGFRTAQPPRKTWEIFVPWETRPDMRYPLKERVTFWQSLKLAIVRQYFNFIDHKMIG